MIASDRAELPTLIAALQLPLFGQAGARSMAELQDFLLANAEVFVAGGIRAIKVQDETRARGEAAAATIARMTAVCAALRREFPSVTLGIIVQAHDAVSPLAIAHAVQADFVRLKVFAGASVTAEGLRQGIGLEAMAYRARLGSGTLILADVHDRTSTPLAPVSNEQAALWTQSLGADVLVLTGGSFEDTMGRIGAARASGVRRPIAVGGGIDAGNVREALAAAQHVIVSTALLRRDAGPDDLVRWDRNAVAQLVEAAAVV